MLSVAKAVQYRFFIKEDIMTKEKFNEVIDFAIDGEKDAVKFYQELQQKTKFQAQKEMMKELENMEKGHIVILENIRSKGMGNVKTKVYYRCGLEDAQMDAMMDQRWGEDSDPQVAIKKRWDDAKKEYENAK